MATATGANGVLEQAARRLERAVGLLESSLKRRVAEAGPAAGGAFDQDRAKLAAELDAARSRERALEEAGAQASQALDRAITELRAALADDEVAEPDAAEA